MNTRKCREKGRGGGGGMLQQREVKKSKDRGRKRSRATCCRYIRPVQHVAGETDKTIIHQQMQLKQDSSHWIRLPGSQRHKQNVQLVSTSSALCCFNLPTKAQREAET